MHVFSCAEREYVIVQALRGRPRPRDNTKHRVIMTFLHCKVLISRDCEGLQAYLERLGIRRAVAVTDLAPSSERPRTSQRYGLNPWKMAYFLLGRKRRLGACILVPLSRVRVRACVRACLRACAGVYGCFLTKTISAT